MCFWGHYEPLFSNPKPGNALALLKFLAKFGPVKREHLTQFLKKRDCLSYFSPDIQNKLIIWEEKFIRRLFHTSRRPSTTVRYFIWQSTVNTLNRCCKLVLLLSVWLCKNSGSFCWPQPTGCESCECNHSGKDTQTGINLAESWRLEWSVIWQSSKNVWYLF